MDKLGTAFAGFLVCVSVWSAAGQSRNSPEQNRASGSACFPLVVPLYGRPSAAGSGWNIVIDHPSNSAAIQDILIVNPYSGPGKAANSEFRSAVIEAHRAGYKVYGYVSTNYGAVPMETVQAQIRKYIAWYAVDGIFVDEVSAKAEQVGRYYQPVASLITSAIDGGGVILNNGTYPDRSYAEMKVPRKSKLQLVIFEQDYLSFAEASFSVPGWIQEHPASMFIDIVYGVSAKDVSNALRLSRERNIGSVYVTDEKLPNPYGKLPSYWSALTRATRAGCAQ